MSPSIVEKRSISRTVVLYAIAVAGVLVYFLFWAHKAAPSLAPFWDARVYRLALQTWHGGRDPYAQAGPYVEHLTFLFVSPPAFLGFMGLTSHVFPGSFGWYVYLALVCLCTLALPALLVWAFFQRTWMSAPLALVIFAFPPNHYGTQALLTGNVSNMLYAAVIGAAGWGLRRQRWLLFYLVLIPAGLVKPMFLAFLLLPLLAGEESLLPSIGVVAGVISGYALQVYTAPALFHAFQQNVRTQIILRGDTGFGLLTYVTRYLHHLPVVRRLGPSVTDGVLVAILVCSMFALRKRNLRQRSDPMWIAGVLVLALLSNPRIQAYDADIALIPAVYIVVNFFNDLPASRWRSVWIGVPVLLFITLVSFEADLGTCLLLLGSVLAVMAHVAWPQVFVRLRTPATNEWGLPLESAR